MSREPKDISGLLTQRGHHYGVYHFIFSDTAGSLLQTLATQFSKLNLDLTQLLQLGSIYVNGMRTQEDLELKSGDYIRLHSLPRRFKVPQNLSSNIVFENENFIVINKPSGLPVHPQVDNWCENLIEGLHSQLGFRYLITHRLDNETSGLLLLAKNKTWQTLLNSHIQKKSIIRKYLCVTEAGLPTGLIEHYMKPSPSAPKEVQPEFRESWQLCQMICHSSQMTDRESLSKLFHNLNADYDSTANLNFISEYEAQLTFSSLFLNEIELFTGRTHQIRAQCARLGCPILGDEKYQSKFYRVNPYTQGKEIALISNELNLEALNLPKIRLYSV